jgi:predicted transcriptional regulator
VKTPYERQLELNQLNQELIQLEPQSEAMRDRRRSLIFKIKDLGDSLVSSLGADDDSEASSESSSEKIAPKEGMAKRPNRGRGMVLFSALKHIQESPTGVRSRDIRTKHHIWPSYLTGLVKDGYAVRGEEGRLFITPKGEAYIQNFVAPLNLGSP